jgi:hypothetical protein
LTDTLQIKDFLVVNSVLAKRTGDVAERAALMGADGAASGLQPAVAVAPVEPGVVFQEAITSLNLEKGIGILRRMVDEERIRA